MLARQGWLALLAPSASNCGPFTRVLARTCWCGLFFAFLLRGYATFIKGREERTSCSSVELDITSREQPGLPGHGQGITYVNTSNDNAIATICLVPVEVNGSHNLHFRAPTKELSSLCIPM